MKGRREEDRRYVDSCMHAVHAVHAHISYE